MAVSSVSVVVSSLMLKRYVAPSYKNMHVDSGAFETQIDSPAKEVLFDAGGDDDESKLISDNEDK